MASLAAPRYAAALFEAGEELGKLEQFYKELQFVCSVFEAEADFAQVLGAPFVSKEEKTEMLLAVFGPHLTQEMQNFLCVLVEKGRVSELPDILPAFVSLYYEKHHTAKAVAVTAIALSDSLRDRLQAKLEQVTGKKILLESKVDPSVLGGVVIEMDGDEIDGSVRHRLDDLRKAISAGGTR